jgi:hypothetical protein
VTRRLPIRFKNIFEHLLVLLMTYVPQPDQYRHAQAYMDARPPFKRWKSKMKTLMATLALVLLTAGSTLAATPTWQLHYRSGNVYVPFPGDPDNYSSTSREG